MNSIFANTTRRIAAIIAVFGTLFTVGGTLTLAEHYAHTDTGTRALVQASSMRTPA